MPTLTYDKHFESKLLTNSGGTDGDKTIFTAGGTIRNGSLFINNPTVANDSFTAHVIPSGSLVSDADTDNAIEIDRQVNAKDGYKLTLPKMKSGDFVVMWAATATTLAVFDNDIVEIT